jgi:hypothetical protein
MQFVKTTESANAMPFINRFEDIQGGVTVIIADLVSGTLELAAGTVLGEEGVTGKYHVVKTAKLHADATNVATTYQVKKNHQFKVGDFITTKDVASTKAYAITVIDTVTGAAVYDIITVGTTLGTAMTAANGVVLNQAAAQDAVGGASLYKYVPKSILGENISWVAGGNAFGSAVVRGTMKESLLPYFVNTDIKTNLTARLMFL